VACVVQVLERLCVFVFVGWGGGGGCVVAAQVIMSKSWYFFLLFFLFTMHL